jgi:membrane-associated protease RseP (regulator of RpoE activity)
VRFPENYDMEKARVLEVGAEKAARERREREGRTAVDDVLNAATFGLLDQRQRQKQKEAARLAQSEDESKRSWWQKTFSGKKSKADVADPEDFEMEYYDDPKLLQNRPWAERAAVLSAGVVMNIVLAFSIYFGMIGFGGGLPQPVFDSGVVVSAMPRQDGPSNGLLQKGDVIVGLNGKGKMDFSVLPPALRCL